MCVCVYEWLAGEVVGWWGTVRGRETSLNDMFSWGFMSRTTGLSAIGREVAGQNAEGTKADHFSNMFFTG